MIVSCSPIKVWVVIGGVALSALPGCATLGQHPAFSALQPTASDSARRPIVCNTRGLSHCEAAVPQALSTSRGASVVGLHCSGGRQCQFKRVDTVVIGDAGHDQVSAAPAAQDLLRLERSDSRNGSRFFVALPAGHHEVEVNFFPTYTNQKIAFTLIHTFELGGRYRLNQYWKVNGQASSLLQMATPNTLCVDLLRNDTVIRQFCRPYNAQTGLGEFVEQKL